jgi:hypothetical protein
MDEQACHAAVDHRHGIIYKEYARYRLSLGPYNIRDPVQSTWTRALNSIFPSFIQSPHATRYTKSFGLPVSLDTVTGRGRPKSRLVFLGTAGANVEFGNGLHGRSRQAHLLILCNTYSETH